MADEVATPQLRAEEEPIQTPDRGKDLTRVPLHTTPIGISRPFGLMDIFRKWQPMGIRVVINLPYIGNDKDFMFYIRPHPFIPYYPQMTWGSAPGLYRMLHPVLHLSGVETSSVTHEGDDVPIPEGVSIYQHSPPPTLAIISQWYRLWRGSMKYRLRAVSSFACQGYMQAALIRGVNDMPSGGYDFNTSQIVVTRKDRTYNQAFLNSYLCADASMFRHMEFVVPFEYESEWYDMATPYHIAYTPQTAVTPFRNLVGVGIRGQIASNNTENQIMFELEYAAGDDFELGIPMPPTLIGNFGSMDNTQNDPVKQEIAQNGLLIPNDIMVSTSRSSWTMKARKVR